MIIVDYKTRSRCPVKFEYTGVYFFMCQISNMLKYGTYGHIYQALQVCNHESHKLFYNMTLV